jgi:two-component system, cell cycle response regulator
LNRPQSQLSINIDSPARFGGDEFALVLPETNAEAANLVAHRICENVADDGKGPKLSVSVGVAVYPQDGDSIERLLCEADARLYAGKQHRILPPEFKNTTAVQ